MNPADFASMCIKSHERDVPLVVVLDGVPVRLIMNDGPHLRVPSGTQNEELSSVEGHGASVIENAPENFVYVAAHAQMAVGGQFRRIENEEGQYLRIDTRRVSFATYGEIGQPVSTGARS